MKMDSKQMENIIEKTILDLLETTLRKDCIGINFKEMFNKMTSDEIKEYTIKIALSVAKCFTNGIY